MTDSISQVGDASGYTDPALAGDGAGSVIKPLPRSESGAAAG